MNQLELTNEQLELFEFILSEFEYQDEKERTLIEQIEAQIYDIKEEDLLRFRTVADILQHLESLSTNPADGTPS